MGEPRRNADHAAIEEATRWFALLRSGAASPEDRRAFEEWRSADPGRAAAYEDALSIWEEIGALDDLKRLASGPDFGRAKRRSLLPFAGLSGRLPAPRLLGYSVLAVTALCVLAVALWRPSWLFPNDYATRIAETEQITLPDGSVTDLGPDSRIEVAYSDAERRIYLKHGEAFFDVRKGDPRLFVVASGDAEVRVTGTKFNVHEGPASITVAVAEGTVEVRRKVASRRADATAAVKRELSAGEQVAAPIGGGGFAEVVETPLSTVGAWRSGRLAYNDARLRDVIADANRYSHIPIIVADEKLLDLEFVAAFRANEINSMIDGLPDILPLEVDRSRKDRIVLRAAGQRSQ